MHRRGSGSGSDDSNEWEEDSGSGGSGSGSSGDVDREKGAEFLGRILGGRYLAFHKLAVGGFATILAAFDLVQKRLVACKVMDAESLEEGEQEVAILERIRAMDQPRLLTHLDAFDYVAPTDKEETEEEEEESEKEEDEENEEEENEEDEEEEESESKEEEAGSESEEGPTVHKVIVMPLLAGSVYDMINSDAFSDGLPEQVVDVIMRDACTAVETLQANDILHTDIKPENLLLECPAAGTKAHRHFMEAIGDYLAEPAEVRPAIKEAIEDMEDELPSFDVPLTYKQLLTARVKLCDFNCCKPLKATIDAGACPDIQTRYYRSPEVLLGCGVTETTDVWSLGCMLYELLTGELLFNPAKGEDGRDVEHLRLIQRLCGHVPDEMLERAACPEAFQVFQDVGAAPIASCEAVPPRYRPMLERMLVIDPAKRATVKECAAFF